MKKTISHVQGKGCISHNNRLFIPKNVDPTRTKENITYVSIEIGSAYDFLFSKPVEEYNSRQKRSDRKINVSYFEHLFNRTPCNTVIESANGQKSFYEDVVQIGTKDDTGIGSADAETAKLCLDEYMKGFQQRNPYFYVFNSVLHMDEATPHLHIDYIPFGHYSRGVSVQNGIAQALAEMGFGKGKDAINRWRQSERNVLKEICKKHSIDISEENPGRGYSMKVEEYKEHQDRIHDLEVQQNQLKFELQPLLEAKNIADNSNVYGTKMPFVNNYIISSNEFDDLETQKKALAVQQNANEKLNVTLSAKIEEYDKHKHELDIREDALRAKETEIRNKYHEQINLNEEHESLRERFGILNNKFQEVRYLETDNRELKHQIDSLRRNEAEIKNQYEKKLSEKESDIVELKETIKNSEDAISELQIEAQQLKEEVKSKKSLINTLYEICEFLAKKLNLCLDEMLDLRIKGYSLNHIFNRNNNNIER